MKKERKSFDFRKILGGLYWESAYFSYANNAETRERRQLNHQQRKIARNNAIYERGTPSTNINESENSNFPQIERKCFRLFWCIFLIFCIGASGMIWHRIYRTQTLRPVECWKQLFFHFVRYSLTLFFIFSRALFFLFTHQHDTRSPISTGLWGRWKKERKVNTAFDESTDNLRVSILLLCI